MWGGRGQKPRGGDLGQVQGPRLASLWVPDRVTAAIEPARSPARSVSDSLDPHTPHPVPKIFLWLLCRFQFRCPSSDKLPLQFFPSIFLDVILFLGLPPSCPTPHQIVSLKGTWDPMCLIHSCTPKADIQSYSVYVKS